MSDCLHMQNQGHEIGFKLSVLMTHNNYIRNDKEYQYVFFKYLSQPQCYVINESGKQRKNEKKRIKLTTNMTKEVLLIMNNYRNM